MGNKETLCREKQEPKIVENMDQKVGRTKRPILKFGKCQFELGAYLCAECTAKVEHDPPVGGEGDDGDQCEWQLDHLHTVEQVVHAGQVLHALGTQSKQKGGHDGDGTGEQHAAPAGPFDL